jgi:hypothetical protein
MQIILSSLAIIISLVAYAYYIWDIWKNNIKPHPLSWFVWTVLMGIGFYIQVISGGGWSSFVLGIASSVSLFIFLYGLYVGWKEKAIQESYTRLEWWSFVGAIFILIFYLFTQNGFVSVILISIVDALGFVPTYIKTWRAPHEEQVAIYGLSAIKFIFVAFSLEVFSFETAFYPIVLVFSNGLFVIFALFRRRMISMSKIKDFQL